MTFDEPEGFLSFIAYSALRVLHHPQIAREVSPLKALSDEFDMQKRSAHNLERAVRLITDCPFSVSSKVIAENILPPELCRYKARYFLFALTRILKPDTVVETGVGGGYASAHVLEAMRLNGNGSLYSIDNRDIYNAQYHNLPKQLPCGGMVPNNLRNGNWMLLMDGAEKDLKPLLEQLGEIDIFIHDSLHTRENMLFEYNTVWEHLKENGLLISHDIWRPWIDFAREKKREYLVYQHYGVLIR